MATPALSEAAQEAVRQLSRNAGARSRTGSVARAGVVEQKSRIGDWEGDTVIGKHHRGALVTLAERKSRYVLAAQVPGKHAPGVTAQVTRLLRPYKRKCHTVTFDNGKEFAEHEKIAAELNADIYFAHPYHSWERGLNEHSYGLLRQYFPKGMELTGVTFGTGAMGGGSHQSPPQKGAWIQNPL